MFMDSGLPLFCNVHKQQDLQESQMKLLCIRNWPRIHTFRRLCSAPAAPVRVRFAPSPTGHLHLGGYRTAVYNYFMAKAAGGKFILRIEDTDQSRLVPDADRKLEEVLRKLNIVPDESPLVGGEFGPYRQSERRKLYQDKIQILLDNGSAYRCFCTEKRLNLLRRESMRLKINNRYDGKCKTLTESEVQEKLSAETPFTVRLKLDPTPEPFDDLILGTALLDIYAAEGDPIIMKSDGMPTYHFANVVDDHEMQISHVLRGTEWHVSTPKHLQIYKAFGWNPPKFAHLPLMMNTDGSKLSKRQNDARVEHLLDERGFYPETVLNFVTLFGGGFQNRKHSTDYFYSTEELMNMFSIDLVNKNSSRMEFLKLEALNRTILKSKLEKSDSLSSLIFELRSVLKSNDLNSEAFSDEFLEKILKWSQNRIFAVSDLVQEEFLFIWRKHMKSFALPQDMNADLVPRLIEVFKNTPSDLCDTEISDYLRKWSKEKKIKFAEVMKLFRFLVIGSVKGPPVGEIVQVLGKEIVIERLENALKLIEQ